MIRRERRSDHTAVIVAMSSAEGPVGVRSEPTGQIMDVAKGEGWLEDVSEAEGSRCRNELVCVQRKR